VRHRAGHLDALELGRHGGRLEEADPDRQVQLVVGILENDDGRLGDGIEGQTADGHLDEVVATHSRVQASGILAKSV
jgi:hypothetical protein